MRTRRIGFIGLFCLVLFFVCVLPGLSNPLNSSQIDAPIVAGASESQTYTVSRVYQTRSVGMDISASASLVLDTELGVVLWEKNSDEVVPIASLTKLFTLAFLYDQLLPSTTEIAITEDDLRPEGGNRRVYLGETILLEDALASILMASDNEVLMAVVRSHGYDKTYFIQAIQHWLMENGFEHTVIVEPTGLSSANVSTAKEVAQIAQMIFHHDLYVDIATQKTKSIQTTAGRSIRIINTNDLLGTWIEYGKTGYTEDANGCFVGFTTIADERPIVSVVLGSSGRAERFVDTKALLYWVEDNYRWYYE